MGVHQGGGQGEINGWLAIPVSVIEGVVIALLNKVMVTVLGAVEGTETGVSYFGLDFINLLGLEWTIVIFVINVSSLLIAYQIGWWIGVFLYLVGWFYMATQISVIGLGLGPIIAGLTLLLFYEYSKL